MKYIIYFCSMAKELKEIKIRYRSGISHDGILNGEPYREYKYDFVTASLTCTKRYNNAVCMLMGINGCPHHLIDWLSNNATDGGYVSNNKITRLAFINFHKQHKKKDNKEYSEHAVIKAFKALTIDGFLIPVEKGVYQVNALMYFSGSEEDRIQSIKYMMEIKSNLETKMTLEIKSK